MTTITTTTIRQLPSVKQIMDSPCSSYWLQNSLQSALKRDCVDAYYDALLLAEMLKREMDSALGR